MSIEQREVAQEQRRQLLERAEYIEKIRGPYWNARIELAKTIISVSSASVVLTVTFSKSFAVPGGSLVWSYTLFASWVSFLASIGMAILTLWLSIELQSVSARLVNPDEIKKRIFEAFFKKDDPSSSIEEAISVISEALSPIGFKDTWAGHCLKISLVTFIVALVLLGLFGWRQFAA